MTESKHKPLEGNVASVLNERELAINIGASQGVKVGMKFKILSKCPTEIVDPSTNELLGTLDREKVRVEVVVVEGKFSICKTYRKKVLSGGALGSTQILRDMLSPPREIVETLKAEDASLPPPLPEEESYIKKGDRVVELLDDIPF